MRLRRVSFPPDTRIEWRIKGWTNDGTSSQDDDGYRNVDEELKIKTDEEAISLFEIKIEELKQAKWYNGKRKYERIEISLERHKEDTKKTLKKVCLAFEARVREEVTTYKTGRGWIESKNWLYLQGEETLKNGYARSKYVHSES